MASVLVHLMQLRSFKRKLRLCYDEIDNQDHSNFQNRSNPVCGGWAGLPSLGTAGVRNPVQQPFTPLSGRCAGVLTHYPKRGITRRLEWLDWRKFFKIKRSLSPD